MFSMDFLVKEFLFDCRVRSLSEQTILNYKKQLGHFVRFLETECKVTNDDDTVFQEKRAHFNETLLCFR